MLTVGNDLHPPVRTVLHISQDDYKGEVVARGRNVAQICFTGVNTVQYHTVSGNVKKLVVM